MQKYAFVDRDGTILWEPERDADGVARSLSGIEEARFIEGAIVGLSGLIHNNFKLVLVTNQDYLGTPSNPSAAFDEVMEFMFNGFAKVGVTFDHVMICPHGPHDNCDCRKPKTGGLRDFLERQAGIMDFEHSLMIGDRNSDEQFARNLGVTFIRIQTNKQWQPLAY